MHRGFIHWCYQKQTINLLFTIFKKRQENIYRNQMEILELQIRITKVNNSVDWYIKRLYITRDRIRSLKNR